MWNQFRMRVLLAVLAIIVVAGFAPADDSESLDATVARLLDSVVTECEQYCFDCEEEDEIKVLIDDELEPGGYNFPNPPEYHCDTGNCEHGECFPNEEDSEDLVFSATHDRDEALGEILDVFETAEVTTVQRLVRQHPDEIVLQPDRRAIQVLGCNGVVGYVTRTDLPRSAFMGLQP